MAGSMLTLAVGTLLLAAVSSRFPSKAAADGSQGECPYPCLPPPTSAANCPPPPSPPTQPSLPGSPPPPQPYTPVYLPPPLQWGLGDVPYYPSPRYDYPAPPPPDPILPYFPYYHRSNSAASLLGRCFWMGLALPLVLLHSVHLSYALMA